MYYGVTVAPVDMIIYKGGEKGYEAAVDKNGTIPGTKTLPIPGFLITLPEDLIQRMEANGDTIESLEFHEKSGTRTWIAYSYDGKSDTIFRFEPTGSNTDPVCVQFKDGEKFVTSDEFFNVGEHINQDLEMSLYPGPEGNAVSAVVITYNGYTYDVDFSSTAT